MTLGTLMLAADAAAEKQAEITKFINGHMVNGYEWHLPFHPIELPHWLPVHALMMIIASVMLLVLFVVLTSRTAAIPSGITNLVEMFVLFVRDDICVPTMGEHDGRKFTPYFCSVFAFLLCLNLMGLVPLFVTATSNVWMTASLALITFAIMILGGLLKNGPVGLFKAFVPSGVPWPLLILLVPLEMVGVLIKIFALTVRLYANMLAGHVVIFSLLGMMILFGFIALPAVGMALFILLIEVLVALLQAYIFTLLSALFVGQIFHPAH